MAKAKVRQKSHSVFAWWVNEGLAMRDAYWHARNTGVACAVVRNRGLYQARVMPVPKSRVVAIINATKRRATR